MFTIKQLSALEILDSRGRPTIRACCRLTRGAEGVASVPSGASTGQAEALELRDGNPKRYRGFGCQQAVRHVNETLHQALSGRSFADQSELDQALLEVDGSANKSRLGANTILSISLSFARAASLSRRVPLYQYFAEFMGSTPLTGHAHGAAESPLTRPSDTFSPRRGEGRGEGASLRRMGGPARTLPRPTINLFSGGKHAGGQAPLQDVLVVPTSAQTMDEALAMTFEIYQCAGELIAKKYGMRPLKADEGGLAPPFPNAQAMLEDAVEAIRAAGFNPGRDVTLAVDVASSHFYHDGSYRLAEPALSSMGMIEQLACWVDTFPIVSLEDGLAEEDWEHWPSLRERLAGRCLVVGDDLLCTNPERIRRAIDLRAADTLLLKVNQIGTLTEAREAYRLARSAGWRVTVSARSGETEDNWLADLAVGWGGDQIKIGSIAQSERLSKYNRLLEIEVETRLPLVSWPRTNRLNARP